MSISERYRDLVADVQAMLGTLQADESLPQGRELRTVAQAAAGLGELEERVGEIPRIRLESELTPVLLKAHTQLDRGRLLLEELGAEDRAAALWELEQKIYRLLNDL